MFREIRPDPVGDKRKETVGNFEKGSIISGRHVTSAKSGKTCLWKVICPGYGQGARRGLFDGGNYSFLEWPLNSVKTRQQA